MKEFKTPSGKVLEIEEASFEDACELNALVIKELLNSDISLSLVVQEIIGFLASEDKKKELSEIEFSDLLGSNVVLEMVSRTFLSLSASVEVRRKVFKCLERSRLDKERILPTSFDSLENRKDYFFVFKNCILTNVLCFI